jgi:hypothetical protein
MGCNLLTAVLNLDISELEDRIAVYRAARGEQGLDPATGTVTVMLHAFLGEGDPFPDTASPDPSTTAPRRADQRVPARRVTSPVRPAANFT